MSSLVTNFMYYLFYKLYFILLKYRNTCNGNNDTAAATADNNNTHSLFNHWQFLLVADLYSSEIWQMSIVEDNIFIFFLKIQQLSAAKAQFLSK